MTLLAAVLLVTVVILAFLRDWRSSLIPIVVVPLSIIGTFGVMYLIGYTIDNLSLMALTLAVGLVVDDAIVMLENIFRYIEEGHDRYSASLKWSEEIGFTVISITVSRIAVFIPILFMKGIVGRLLREFGVVVSIAIAISAVVALTLSPVMASRLLPERRAAAGWLYTYSERIFDRFLNAYKRGLGFALHYRRATMMINVALIILSGSLFYLMPKGFFPQQDTGQLFGFTQADQSVSFDELKARQASVNRIIAQDPDVQSISSAVGGSDSAGMNTGWMFVQLRPYWARSADAEGVIRRLRPGLNMIPGIETFLQSIQNVRIESQVSATQYQYALQSSKIDELSLWAPRVLAALERLPALTDAASDQRQGASQLMLTIDRDTAARLGVSMATIQQTLYDAFGRPFIAQLYGSVDTYHIVLRLPPPYQADASALSRVYVRGTNGRLIPLNQFAAAERKATAISVNHQGQFPSITISFNVAQGFSLSDAVAQIENAVTQIGKPDLVQGTFQGTAREFRSSLATQPLLILAAIFAVYIVLGILYESFIHPITILLTLPSASVGALLFLYVFGFELTMMAIIGLLMLIGIVKKNGIMMVDFAMEKTRREKCSAEAAIFDAAVMRFRPILMTTAAAVFVTLPIALGIGAGADLRQPLGVSVLGGLLVSQAVTLFTTPVTYLYLEQFRGKWFWDLSFWRSKIYAE